MGIAARSGAAVVCWLGLVLGSAQAARAQQAGSPRGAVGGAEAALAPVAVGGPAAPAQAPFPPLSEKHQQYLDSILKYWEHSSAQVQRYRCRFKRWEYDCVFGPRDTYKTYSEGEIKYAAPDKGLFRVERVWEYRPAQQPGQRPGYFQADDARREYWVCDGQSIFEFDYKKKQLIERRLPPELRGQSITEGPLPFLFGAKAETIKRRYWLRVITPPEAKGEYWLEAWPKRQEDAVNYKKVHVILDEEKFLPKGLIVFDRSYDPVRSPSRTTFAFEQRETNWSLLPEKLNLFHREFYKPATPRGWTRVVEDFAQTAAAPAAAPAAAR